MIRTGHPTTVLAGGNLTRSLVSSTTVYTDQIRQREATLRCRRLNSWSWRIREHCSKEGSAGIKRPETILRKSGSIFILGSGMVALRCPFRINNSKQRSENIEGEQEMPSITLFGTVLNKKNRIHDGSRDSNSARSS